MQYRKYLAKEMLYKASRINDKRKLCFILLLVAFISSFIVLFYLFNKILGT